MPDDKDMDRGGGGQRAKDMDRGRASEPTDPAGIANDIFRRVTQLGGLLIVAVVAPVGPGAGSTSAASATQRALLGIAESPTPIAPGQTGASEPVDKARGVAERRKMIAGQA